MAASPPGRPTQVSGLMCEVCRSIVPAHELKTAARAKEID